MYCFCFLFAVGGPLRFLDLENGFLETEQKLTEILLCMLQQELSEYCFVSCFIKLSLSRQFCSRNFITQGFHQGTEMGGE